MEIDLSVIETAADSVPAGSAPVLSGYPVATQDVALNVPDEVPAGQVQAALAAGVAASGSASLLEDMLLLRSRLLKLREDEEKARYAAERKSQIGSGDRSERIRTYNFPQNRVTDHRIGLTLHGLPQIMEGAIGPLIDALQKAHYEERLAALEGRSYELVKPSAELG